MEASYENCPVGLFYAIGDSNGISYCIKKADTKDDVLDICLFSIRMDYWKQGLLLK